MSRQEKLKEARRQELVNNLSAMRTKEGSDVILVCENKNFFAHKCILEASSLYFKAMFNVGPEEFKSKELYIKDVKCDILEAILEYVYTGEVTRITGDQVKMILKAAHLMQLKQLVEYCYDILTEMLSINNCLDTLNIAVTYCNNTMLHRVFNFMIVMTSDVFESGIIANLSFEQIIAFLQYSKEKLSSYNDIILKVFKKWLFADVQARSQYSSQLFALVDPTSLGDDAMRELVEYAKLSTTPVEIANEINKLAATSAYLVSKKQGPEENIQGIKRSPFADLKLAYLTQLTIKTDLQLNLVRIVPSNDVHEFHFDDLSWRTLEYGNSGNGYITMPATRNIIAVQSIVRRDCAAIEVEYLFKTKKTNTTNLVESIEFWNCARNKWSKMQALNHARIAPSIFATSKYIYVVGESESSKEIIIEYLNVSSGNLQATCWQTLRTQGLPTGIKVHFFVYKGTLRGLYLEKGDLVFISLHHEKAVWFAKVGPAGPSGITEVACISNEKGAALVFVSTSVVAPRIPNYTWDPETGHWTALRPMNTTFDLSNLGTSMKLYHLRQPFNVITEIKRLFLGHN